MPTITSISQAPTKNSQNENLYIKEIPAAETLSGKDEYLVYTLESLQERKAQLEAELAEVNDEIATIQGLSGGLEPKG